MWSPSTGEDQRASPCRLLGFPLKERAFRLPAGSGEFSNIIIDVDEEAKREDTRVFMKTRAAASCWSGGPEAVSINKAINTQEVAVKEKHARNILLWCSAAVVCLI
ncbi:hypothetical protein EYF80_059477 [Liparis tanakae]|uniref:AP180 N-terminal homology (ANTH) domain-containing protein n=1 Tax=Liparis tanakae TaxID=230148 RepID=A0A4Z2EPY4_9TELE|nr:hypothetical protein EYF80_059477 [Liparis tanakae]